jgi:hypothetical protein
MMGFFLLVLVVPFAYLLSTGALDWGPVSKVSERIVRPVLRAAGMPDIRERVQAAAGEEEEAA